MQKISSGIVSIHAPVWGATLLVAFVGSDSGVSIHAPVWGATTVMLWSGLSFHELISLAVEDLDLEKGCLFVNRSFVRDQYRVTKNRRRKRQVDFFTAT